MLLIGVGVSYFLSQDAITPAEGPASETAAATPAATQPLKSQDLLEFNPDVADTIHDMAAHFTDAAGDFNARDEKLRQFASSLSEEDLSKLALTLGRNELNNDERRAGVYFLGLAGPAAIHSLGIVAAKPLPQVAGLSDPHSSSSIQNGTERALRLQALQRLDEMAASEPDVKTELQKILAQQTDPSLIFFTKVSLMGIQEGRPGKLQRLSAEVLGEGE